MDGYFIIYHQPGVVKVQFLMYSVVFSLIIVNWSHSHGKQIALGLMPHLCSHESKEHQIASYPVVDLKSDSWRSSSLRTNEHLCFGFCLLIQELKCFKGGKHSKVEIWWQLYKENSMLGWGIPRWSRWPTRFLDPLHWEHLLYIAKSRKEDKVTGFLVF